MNEIYRFLNCVEIPSVVKIRQTFNDQRADNPENTLLSLLESKVENILPGVRIAITGGSRGIDKYVPLMKTIVGFLKSKGAEPFIVPAMGSHGGATAEGQTRILEMLGVTEATTGAPVISSVEVKQIGTTEKNLPVYMDKRACEADGIVLFNRIKPHTAFRGEYESGLLKMLAIGLAKPKGAQMTHCLRLENMPQNIIDVGTIALDRLPILFGVGTVENGYGGIAEIYVLQRGEILPLEPSLLKKARAMMPRIYLDNIDALVIQEIGKEISGAGMDGNIVGRYASDAVTGGPKVTSMGVLDLTDHSDGNGNGMGYADYGARRLIEKVDFVKTYMNTLTTTQPRGTKVPMILDTDKMVCQVCVRSCGIVNGDSVRMVLIKNTKAIDEIYMTSAAVREICDTSKARAVGEYFDLPFDVHDALTLFR
ncbi:MAG: lactate racemase domain-containing protein [Synergistaceae bacterium]|nr:lactate racemase domain-containing protein [Synergistaceae bacterium]